MTRNEDKNILPYADDADYKINSLLGYECGMLKYDLDKLLPEISPDSPYYQKGCEILTLLDGIDTISPEYLPEGSLYHEFM